MNDDVKREALIRGLNEDLANEYAAVITYRTYASQVQGPWRMELRAFFEGEIVEELGHAQLLADKIVALGGTPTMAPAPTRSADDPKTMLENTLADEVATIGRYVERRALAESLGEHGLAIELDTLIADETRHPADIRLILTRWI